jgi:hypothetical protein
MPHATYATTTLELNALDLCNLKMLVRYRLDKLHEEKAKHPDLANIFDEQIVVYAGTFDRLDRAHTDMYPSRAN